jgi:hypothetical protein
VTLVLTASLLVPIHAHTSAEMAVWDEAWHTTAEVDLSAGLLAELVDMRHRHPWYWAEPTQNPPRVDTTVHRGMGSDVEQWRPLVAAYPWNVDTALCLMAHESGGNPDAYNSSSGASGLMQVLSSWASVFGYKSSDLFDAAVNLKISAALYADGGWGHWSPWLRGECR